MADTFALVIEGLVHLEKMTDLPVRIVTSARIAVNEAARDGRKWAADKILSEVKFPRDYVAPGNGRLRVSRFASNGKLEAAITARTRATSLARFQVGTPILGARRGRRQEGVRVEVTPGAVQRLPGAFLIRLRAGSGNIDTKSNMGLAVRTKNGRPPPGYKPVRLAENLWLLYGPSVAQVFHSDRNRGGVATDISPDIADELEREFFRQLDLR